MDRYLSLEISYLMTALCPKELLKITIPRSTDGILMKFGQNYPKQGPGCSKHP